MKLFKFPANTEVVLQKDFGKAMNSGINSIVYSGNAFEYDENTGQYFKNGNFVACGESGSMMQYDMKNWEL